MSWILRLLLEGLEEEVKRVRKAKLKELIEEATRSMSMSFEDWVRRGF